MPVILSLLACIDFGMSEVEDDPAVATDSGVPAEDTQAETDTATGDDTATDTATAPDTGADTGAVVDTAADTGSDTSTDTATDTDTEPDPAPPSPAGTCPSYPYSSWADAAATVPQLNVIGIYEASGGTGSPVPVEVTTTTEGVLALTSYSAVEWQVDLPAGHGITSVVLSYYDASTVTFVGAGSAPVDDAGWIGACAYEYPDMDPRSGCETPDLERVVEAYTGLAMSSFQGCYAAGNFELN